MTGKIETYAEFWPFYLGEHRKRATRLVHVAGTGVGVALFIVAVAACRFDILLMALAAGYGYAWLAHLFIEKNRPASFSYPAWSLRADFQMAWFWLTGRLEAELVRNNILT
ncbi:MAG: DUF962 domain-containing protein [Alphaproteobacteria bacterium]